MGIVDEIKSKRLTIYAQWLAVFDAIVLLTLAIVEFFVLIYFSFIAFIMACLIAIMEVPFFTRYFSKLSVSLTSIFGGSKSQYFRAFVYFIFALIQGLSLIGAKGKSPYSTTMVLTAVVSILYLIAGIRGEPLLRSFIFGSGNIEELPSNNDITAPEI